MRKLSYLSPTSLSKFIENQDEFYLLYLAENRAPRGQQTLPMSIGSAFDAYTKSYLFEKLIGRSDPDWPKFNFITLFEAQVDPINRTWALKHGKYVFDQYVSSGALASIIIELENSIGRPRFEMDIMGFVNNDILNIPFLGKPDIFFVNKEGYQSIYDWKVNGYCSKIGASPKKGYIKILPDYVAHKEAVPIRWKGIVVNGNQMLSLHNVDESWARQTCIYGWLCGCQVGSDFGIGIEQVACNNRYNTLPGENYPELRFAQHRYRSDRDFQQLVYRQAAECWTMINNGPENYYRGLSPSESKSRCDTMEARAKGLFFGLNSEEDKLFKLVCD